MSRLFSQSGCLFILFYLQWSSTTLLADEMVRAAQREFFESRIRPVLIEKCYECHNSIKKAEGGLAIDHRAGLLKGGDSGPVLLPGNAKESLLLQVLRHEAEGMEMPKSAPKLSDAVIADFEKWVQLGAIDPRDQPPTADDLAKASSWETLLEKRKHWWSFQPLRPQEIPAVQNNAWSAGEIDRFILAALESKQLTPGPDAEPGVLIRRLYFVLTGLPPTESELATWGPRLSVSEQSLRRMAYQQLVDELLASPQFGEHWARHWMDWIRYAESHGSEGDPDIGEAWRYRDYLIRAMNADVPYDQLVREHIAGDLLEQPRLNQKLQINESVIGPAHWRMVFHGFTPTDALDEKVRFIDDAVNVCSKAFLGLTVSCARCHNHKFDAISQADYYALFGILGSCRPGRSVIDLPNVREKNISELNAIKIEMRNALAQQWLEQLTGAGLQWGTTSEADTPAKAARGILQPWFKAHQQLAAGKPFEEVLEPLKQQLQAEQQKKTEFLRQESLKHWNVSLLEGSSNWLKTGQGLANSPSVAGDFAVSVSDDTILAGLFPAGLYTHLTSSKHGARLQSPDVQLNGETEAWLRICGDGKSVARYVVQHYPRNGTVYSVVKLSPTWQWLKLDMSYWKGDTVFLEIATARDAPIPASEDERSWFGIQDAIILPKGSVPPQVALPAGTEVLLTELSQSAVRTSEDLQKSIVRAMTLAVQAWQAGKATDAQAELLESCRSEGLLPNTLTLLPALRPLVDRYRTLEAEIRVPQRVPGLDELEAHDQPLLVRGDHKHPAERIPRRFLEAIDATPYHTAQSGRRQLAEDLLREDNPLTRRVIVNRIWHHVFGQGLVRTPDNLGMMGELPTHPELLDWLAAHFPRQGWSFKRLIREMVLSHTWQLAGTTSLQATEIDPDNRLLSHASVRRLEAESIRDSILHVSGQLDRAMFGPPVNGNSTRRSIYVAVRRNSLDSFLREFDFPEPFSTTGRRDVTNVPAQSLTMMNDDRIVRASVAWGEKLNRQDSGLSVDERIEKMFLAAIGRKAAPPELDMARQYLDNARVQHRDFARRREALHAEIRGLASQNSELLRGVALRTEAPPIQVEAQAVPRPLARWEFENDSQDSIGSMHTTLVGDARLENGAAVVGGKGYFISQPLAVALKERTLEAWVQLDSVDQRGGGVMTIQSDDGQVFDSIVFAEMNSRLWMAGSDFSRRTKPFHGPLETESLNRPVHLAITYRADGTITGFRNGVPYGQPYQADGVIRFPESRSVVTFGLRHLPAGGNRFLAGRIFKAQLYDRALSAEEVHASFLSDPHAINDAALLAKLTPEEHQQFTQAVEKQRLLRTELKALPESAVEGVRGEWSDLAHGLFLLKEFLYLK